VPRCSRIRVDTTVGSAGRTGRDALSARAGGSRSRPGGRVRHRLVDPDPAEPSPGDRIRAAKTKEMFKQATRPRGTDLVQFQACMNEAKEALKPLSRAVCEALYEGLGQRELYIPDAWSGQQEDAEAAVRDDLLTFDE
jgi:hypothetical protein